MLLSSTPGATSFEYLKTVGNYVCSTFKEACIKRGLLESDLECYSCLSEAALMKSGKQLRNLFVTILVFCEPAEPEKLW